MAKIPLYDAHVLLNTQGPGVAHDIRSFGMEHLAQAQTLENVGQAGGLLTDTGLKLYRGLQQQQDTSEYVSSSLKFGEQMRTAFNTAKQQEDPDSWGQVFKAEAQKILEAGSQLNPRIAPHMNMHLGKLIEAYDIKISNDVAKYKIGKLKATLPQQMEQSIPEILDAPDEESAARIRGVVMGAIRAAAHPESGFLKPDEAYKLEIAYLNQINEGRFYRSLQKDPIGTEAALKTPGAFGFDDKQQYQAKGAVQVALNRLHKDNAVKVDEAYEAGNLTLDGLRELSKSRQISRATYRTYEAALVADASPGGKAKQNMDVYIPLLEQAKQGQLDMEAVYRGMKAGDLTKADHNTLFRMNESENKAEKPAKELAFMKNEWFKLADRDITDRLKRRESLKERWMGQKGKPAGPLPVNLAKGLFMQLCQDEIQKGRAPGPWMMDEADKIIQKVGQMDAEQGPRPKGGPRPPAGTVSMQMDELPNATQYAGKVARDTKTGKRFKSNGKQWLPVE